jgi:hypothetical protein
MRAASSPYLVTLTQGCRSSYTNKVSRRDAAKLIARRETASVLSFELTKLIDAALRAWRGAQSHAAGAKPTTINYLFSVIRLPCALNPTTALMAESLTLTLAATRCPSRFSRLVLNRHRFPIRFQSNHHRQYRAQAVC